MFMSLTELLPIVKSSTITFPSLPLKLFKILYSKVLVKSMATPLAFVLSPWTKQPCPHSVLISFSSESIKWVSCKHTIPGLIF